MILVLLIFGVLCDAKHGQNQKKGFLGTTNLFAHNSYHVRQYQTFTTYLDHDEINVFLPTYHYSWPSLTELLDHNICGFEFDIWPKDDHNSNDFVVEHVYFYDNHTTCNTLSKCLNQIAIWMTLNKHKQSCPINIELKLKVGINQFSNDDLFQINEIVTNSFSAQQLHTPKTHGAKATDIHWPNWQNKIQNNQVFVNIDMSVINKLYRHAAATLLDNNGDTNNYEDDYNLFARCQLPTDARYCVVCEGDITSHASYRDEYVFTAHVAKRYIQLPEYPLIEFHGEYYVKLDESVTNDANYWKEQFGLTSHHIETDLVHWKTWNSWAILANIDALTNNDGFITAHETADVLYQILERDDKIYGIVDNFFNEEDILGMDDGNKWKLEGLHVNNPLLWLGISMLLDELNDVLIPRINLKEAISETCLAIKNGYDYIKSDYPYQLELNGNTWQFTISGIQCVDDDDDDDLDQFEDISFFGHTVDLMSSTASIIFIGCIIAFIGLSNAILTFCNYHSPKINMMTKQIKIDA